MLRATTATVTKKPTCEEPGIQTRYCQDPRCRYKDTEEIEPLGHEMCVEVASYPTNTEEGSIRHYCCRKGCNYHYFEAVPVLGIELDEKQTFIYAFENLNEEQQELFGEVVSYNRELTDYYNEVFGGIKPVLICCEEKPYPGDNGNWIAVASVKEPAGFLGGGEKISTNSATNALSNTLAGSPNISTGNPLSEKVNRFTALYGYQADLKKLNLPKPVFMGFMLFGVYLMDIGSALQWGEQFFPEFSQELQELFEFLVAAIAAWGLWDILDSFDIDLAFENIVDVEKAQELGNKFRQGIKNFLNLDYVVPSAEEVSLALMAELNINDNATVLVDGVRRLMFRGGKNPKDGKKPFRLRLTDLKDLVFVEAYKLGLKLEDLLDKYITPNGGGVSVNVNPFDQYVENYGGANLITSLPEGLMFVQEGKNLTHYVISPMEPMSLAKYLELLDKITYEGVETTQQILIEHHEYLEYLEELVRNIIE